MAPMHVGIVSLLADVQQPEGRLHLADKLHITSPCHKRLGRVAWHFTPNQRLQ